MNRIWVVLGLLVIIIALAWFLFAGSPVSAPTDGTAGRADGPVTFTVLKEGANAVAVTEGKNYRIQNQEQLVALWAMIYGDTAPALPTVNWNEQEVLAVFGGKQNSGGYDVSVKEVVDRGGTRIVSILHTVPGDNCVTTQALTSPFELITVPIGSDNLTHEDEVVTTSCS